MHNRLGDVEALNLRRLGEDHPDAVLLDAGDAVGAGNLGFRTGGEPILERMNELGYSAMALGNREAHLWQKILELKVKSARFPVLSANIVMPHPSTAVQPWIRMEVEGIRTGIVGLTVPMITRTMWSRHLCDLLFENPHKAAQSAAEELRPHVDLLIALSHLGEKEDRRLADTGTFDLILGGHSHILTESPERVGRTWVCHTGSHARFAGVWTVERDQDAWSVQGGLRPLKEAA